MKPIDGLTSDCPYCIRSRESGCWVCECVLQEGCALFTEPCTFGDLEVCMKRHPELHSKRVVESSNTLKKDTEEVKAILNVPVELLDSLEDNGLEAFELLDQLLEEDGIAFLEEALEDAIDQKKVEMEWQN